MIKWHFTTPFFSITHKFSLVCVRAKSLPSCLTLGDPVDHNLLGSSVHEFLQARIVEWVAMPSSRGSSRPRESSPRLLPWQQVLYHQCHLGSPNFVSSQEKTWFYSNKGNLTKHLTNIPQNSQDHQHRQSLRNYPIKSLKRPDKCL